MKHSAWTLCLLLIAAASVCGGQEALPATASAQASGPEATARALFDGFLYAIEFATSS